MNLVVGNVTKIMSLLSGNGTLSLNEVQVSDISLHKSTITKMNKRINRRVQTNEAAGLYKSKRISTLIHLSKYLRLLQNCKRKPTSST